jgi:uncharacterized protein
VPTVRHRTTVKLAVLLLLFLALSGCSKDLHYIFTSSADSRGLPVDQGMAYQEVWFPAADGQRLHGWYIPGRRSGPLIFYCHGNTANISYRLDILDYFNTRLGLPVFIFDYRGYGESTGEAQAEDDLYQDARGALAYLAGRGWEPARMVYYGRSLGSAIALQMALEQPPAGLVLESAFSSLRAVAWHLRPVSFTLFGFWLLGHAYDNQAKIGRLRVPLLVIQGGADRIVLPAMSARLFASAPQPKRRVVIAGAGHSDCFRVGGTAYFAAWEDFLATLRVPPSGP